MARLPFLALLRRELLTSLRRKRTYAMLAATMSLLMAALLLFLGGIAPAMQYNPGMQAQLTQIFLGLFSFLLFAAGALFMPALGGASICVEKQRESFPLLKMTLIRPSGIVAAKLLNAITIYLLIFIAAMPLVGLVFFFVGIEWAHFAVAFVLLLSSSVGCGAIGILCSAYFYRTTASLLFSYLGMLAFVGGLPGWLLLALIQLEMKVFRLYELDEYFDFLIEHMGAWSPIILLGFSAAPFGTLNRYDLIFGLGLQVMAIAVFLWGAARILRRPVKPMKTKDIEIIDNAAALEKRRKTFPYYLVDPSRRRRAIPDGRNPMLAKELQTGLLSSGAWRIRVFYVFGVISLAMAMPACVYQDSSDFQPLLALTILWQSVFIVLVAPAAIATALAKEHELHNMDMLRTSLLGSRRILQGKLFSAFAAVSPLLLASFLGMLPALVLIRNVEAFSAYLSGYGSMLIALFLTVCVGLFAAIFCRQTTTALVSSYLANIMVHLLVPLLTIVVYSSLDVLGTGVSSGREIEDVWPWLPSPLLAQLSNISKARLDVLLNARWLINSIGCLLLSLSLLALSVGVFNRNTMRER